MCSFERLGIDLNHVEPKLHHFAQDPAAGPRELPTTSRL